LLRSQCLTLILLPPLVQAELYTFNADIAAPSSSFRGVRLPIREYPAAYRLKAGNVMYCRAMCMAMNHGLHRMRLAGCHNSCRLHIHDVFGLVLLAALATGAG